MQERDEDLYFSYQKINKLEKIIEKQNRINLILGFIIGGIALIVVLLIFIRIYRFRRLKPP